jgi:vancomycin resistance protein YoaR
MTEIAALLTHPIRRLGRPVAIAIGLALVLALATTALAVRAFTLRDSVLPGVRVAGVDVGGLSRPDARGRIEVAIAERLRQPVDVSVDGQAFTVQPDTLFTVDATATERLAFVSARESFSDELGALAAPFLLKHDVDPVLRVSPGARADLLRQTAKRTERSVSASISMHGKDPVVVPGRTGTRVDAASLLAAIREAALRGLPAVKAPVTPVEPEITTAAAERAAATARTAVSAPVAISFRHEELTRIGPAHIAALLRFEPTDAGEFELTLDGRRLRAGLEPLVRPFVRRPVEASFSVVGERVRVVKGRNGTTLDAAGAQEAVLAAAVEPGVRMARIGLEALEPTFSTRDARALGIKRQVSTYTTDMGPSSANRIWNVHLMADYIDGTIIKPGDTFSFNETVGPRTPQRGFREGQMIIGSLLVPAIGGGVCQTATTLFNNAFELGLPVKERHNHSWYISHYPIGRDATVSWGGPDLKFKNDLKDAILIKTSYTDSTLTFSFYGTRQGRKVVASTGPRTNFRSPQPSYAYDPAAPRGSVRTVAGSHAQGFDITVFRKVYEHGKLIRNDSFTSNYTAVGDTVIYGPGTHPPRIDFVLPSI